jgi:ubiquinone/menaquinone biosynthesis C-methylase UbiE/nucleoside 2-deoxyribosyltransferase
MRIFLSGDTRTAWQSELINRFPHDTFFDPRTLSEKTYREMAETERAWLDQSDLVFAYLNQTNPYGFGTCFEIGYAVANKKIIIYVDEKQVSSSQWIGEHLKYVYKSLEEGISKLAELLAQGNSLIADTIVDRLKNQDFTVLVQRELDDDLVSRVTQKIHDDFPMYTRLMLASKMLPRRWYDWNLGYLLQRLSPSAIIMNLEAYPENLYHSEGTAWALGLIGNDDERIIRFLQEQCRRCEDYDAWWCAAHSLEQLNQGDAIEILKRTLVQSEWQDLDFCLANIGSRPATIGLLRKMNKQNSSQIVSACLKGLRDLSGRRLHNVIWLLERFRLRDRQIIDALTQMHDTNVEYGSAVAHRVVEALGQIAHPSSRGILERDLLEAGYFRTRAWAAKGLGSIGDYKSIEVLERALTREEEPHVLSMITSALYNIRDPERKKDNELIGKAGWLENGMIIDETNKWYWSAEIYDRFAHAEDPEAISFSLAVSLAPPESKVALDLAAGTGRFVEQLKEKHTSLELIYALDNSDEMVRYLNKKFARETTPRVETLYSTIAAIPLPEESVDLVVSSWGFPSRVWDESGAYEELNEVYRVLHPDGVFITIGWDEDFSDQMTEVWYRFVMEQDYYFDSLSEYRRRKRARIASPRNCGLTIAKRRLRVPVKFNDKREAAYVFGHLFGYSAGIWVLENDRKEFQMYVSITRDDKNSLNQILSLRDQSGRRSNETERYLQAS